MITTFEFMNSLRVCKVIIFTSLCVIFLVDLFVEAGKLKARQSLSQKTRQPKRKKDGDSLSNNKNHFQSKVIIMCAIGDYEVEFNPAARGEHISEVGKAMKDVKKITVDMANNTVDEDACRKEIHERKQKWKYFLENPPSKRIARLKTRVESCNDQFTLEEFCQAVAILYQRLKDDIDLETRGLAKASDNPISKYSRTNFVIPFLLEDYPGEIGKLTEELIMKELQKTND